MHTQAQLGQHLKGTLGNAIFPGHLINFGFSGDFALPRVPVRAFFEDFHMQGGGETGTQDNQPPFPCCFPHKLEQSLIEREGGRETFAD